MPTVSTSGSSNCFLYLFTNRIVSMAAMFVLIIFIGIHPQQGAAEPAFNKSQMPPNFVFILIDDMRWDVMSCAGHPFVKTPNIDRIAEAGIRFTNAFVTTSLCSPARASFLTGCYARKHGVRINGKMDLTLKTPTFPQILQTAGYETAFVGKWHMSGDPHPRPGFDYWLSFPLQGEYIDPQLNENGKNFSAKGYMTDILTKYTVDYLKRPKTKPFCICLSHKAMHANFTPAKRHKSLYAPSDLIKPDSWQDTLEGKPRWLREITLRGGRLKKPLPPGGVPDLIKPGQWEPEDETNQRRLNWYRTLAAVDESVGQVLDTLQANGLAENTFVIFSSDNGFFLGEHRRKDKRLAYEESIRIPLLICGPGVVDRGKVLKQMVLNIDLAPTILELAGTKIPTTVQGSSFSSLLVGKKTKWRQSFLYEYFMEEWLPGIPTMVAVRTHQWKYIHYPEINDTDELYNLKDDPHELHNLIDNADARRQLDELKAELDRLTKKYEN